MASATLNEEEIALLAGAMETPVGRAILHAVAIEAGRVSKGIDDPRLNTERVKDDFRYVLGELRGVGFLGRKIEDARKQLGITSGE
jgi:hypothetical protein